MKILEDTLFGENPRAEVVIGYLNAKPISFALFFHNFSTFLGRPGIYLEDLYVTPEARGKGLGQKILAYLAHLAESRHCGRLEWWVLNWNEDAIGFYQRLGAKPMDEWTVYRLTDTALTDLAASWK
jgi:GNAT superfamily N-acetyltransferase